MAEYVVIDITPTLAFCTECDSEHQALTEAQKQWDALTNFDRNRRTEFVVIRSDNPDETAPDHLDGAIIKIWK